MVSGQHITMVNEIVKHLIIACGCWNETTQEWVNKCGTPECPILNGRIKGVVNGAPLKEFSSGEFEEEEDPK